MSDKHYSGQKPLHDAVSTLIGVAGLAIDVNKMLTVHSDKVLDVNGGLSSI